MIGGGGPPKYLKSATFKNESGDAATINATFQSGRQQTYQVAAGATQVVDAQIDHGTWTGSDPITAWTVTAKGKTSALNDVPAFIAVWSYTIGADGNVTKDA